MLWTVYLDESGTHDASPILVMGAVAATANQWQIFDRQWEAVLEREQLPYIHHVDLVGRRKIYRKYSMPEVNQIGAELTRLSQLGMRAGGKGRGIKAGRSKVSTTWRVAGAEPPEQER